METVNLNSQAGMSFDSFVSSQTSNLIGFAYLLTSDREEAREIVQDVLVKLWPRWDKLVAKGDPGAYVRRCIANARVSRWRRRRNTEPLTDDISVEDSSAGYAARDWAVRLCATLPQKQRVAVVLRVLEDREFAEVAQICECSEASARSLVSRGLAKLRQQLTPEGNSND
jgi:RNA polymerase sigma-70 factor (sigma-E family)